MHILPIKTSIFGEGDDILSFITDHIKRLKENSVLVVTSKIVALGEGRTAPFSDKKTKGALIKKESEWALQTKYVWLTYKDGMYMANAGVDESNANGKIVLLPRDSFRSAETIRRKLLKHYGVKNLGVVITDSRTMALRRGVTGVALGYAGIRGLRDYRGTADLFGKKFEYSTTNVPDGIAAAAVVVMGEGTERYPLALVTDAPAEFTNKKTDKNELRIDPKDDMYAPLFKKFEGLRRKQG